LRIYGFWGFLSNLKTGGKGVKEGQGKRRTLLKRAEMLD